MYCVLRLDFFWSIDHMTFVCFIDHFLYWQKCNFEERHRSASSVLIAQNSSKWSESIKEFFLVAVLDRKGESAADVFKAAKSYFIFFSCQVDNSHLPIYRNFYMKVGCIKNLNGLPYKFLLLVPCYILMFQTRNAILISFCNFRTCKTWFPGITILLQSEYIC